jgi:hypothetical protein
MGKEKPPKDTGRDFTKRRTVIIDGIPLRPETAELHAAIKTSGKEDGAVQVRERRMGSSFKSS